MGTLACSECAGAAGGLDGLTYTLKGPCWLGRAGRGGLLLATLNRTPRTRSRSQGGTSESCPLHAGGRGAEGSGAGAPWTDHALLALRKDKTSFGGTRGGGRGGGQSPLAGSNPRALILTPLRPRWEDAPLPEDRRSSGVGRGPRDTHA